jgi:hypothetical protein
VRPPLTLNLVEAGIKVSRVVCANISLTGIARMNKNAKRNIPMIDDLNGIAF